MKKRILSMCLGLALLCGMILLPINQVKAEDLVADDGTVLIMDTESEGVAELFTKGVYLRSGSCKITKVGSGKINASGTTIAQKQVATVKVSVIIERYTGSSWVHVTSFAATASNDVMVNTSKNLTVAKGYYYRVRAIHSANSDGSSSATGGIMID